MVQYGWMGDNTIICINLMTSLKIQFQHSMQKCLSMMSHSQQLVTQKKCLIYKGYFTYDSIHNTCQNPYHIAYQSEWPHISARWGLICHVIHILTCIILFIIYASYQAKIAMVNKKQNDEVYDCRLVCCDILFHFDVLIFMVCIFCTVTVRADMGNCDIAHVHHAMQILRNHNQIHIYDNTTLHTKIHIAWHISH
jgi:hypothetical protein